jgi:hypothetical protein
LPRAQQPAMPVIGWLGAASPDIPQHLRRAFREGLQESAYIEGQNVAIEYLSAEGQYDRLPGLIGDLVRRQVALLVATGGVHNRGPTNVAIERRQLLAQVSQHPCHNRIHPTQQMDFGYALFEVGQVEQLALIARLPPHHGESPSDILKQTESLFASFHEPFFNIIDPRRTSVGRPPLVIGNQQSQDYLPTC